MWPRSSSGASGNRNHIRVLAMKFLPRIIRPFNEVTARLMTLGLHSATQASPFPEWKAAADRFGVQPMTVEQYVQQMRV